MTDNRHPVILDPGAPPDPGYVLEVAEAVARGLEVLCYQTRHREALDPDAGNQLAGFLDEAVAAIPQLLGQFASWYEREAAQGRLEVAGGEWKGVPGVAVVAVRLRADYARGLAEGLQEALAAVASVTCNLAAAETGEDSDG